jgi:hypothetical protein
MSPEQFTHELRTQSKRLDLTASDLAVWFARPRSTVRTWLANERTPKTGRVLDECARRLKLLRSTRALPVPYAVMKFERLAYVKRAFDHADNAGVSARNSARAR